MAGNPFLFIVLDVLNLSERAGYDRLDPSKHKSVVATGRRGLNRPIQTLNDRDRCRDSGNQICPLIGNVLMANAI
jgi:hypothetical protein